MSDAPSLPHSVFISGPSASADASSDSVGAASLILTATLLAAVHAHHPATAAHALRVASLVARIAPLLPGEPYHGRIAEVYAAAALHDSGKLLIPLAILAAPRALTATEWAAVIQHPSHSRAILRRVGASPLLVAAAWAHHERWDGSARGYPRRLTGEEIPAIARLVALCDAYDAMIEDRPYHAGLTPAAARVEIEHGAGTQFDPALVAWVIGYGLLS